jgi:hypothetical protein
MPFEVASRCRLGKLVDLILFSTIANESFSYGLYRISYAYSHLVEMKFPTRAHRKAFPVVYCSVLYCYFQSLNCNGNFLVSQATNVPCNR